MPPLLLAPSAPAILQLDGWIDGGRESTSSHSSIQLWVCLLKLSPVGVHLCFGATLKTVQVSHIHSSCMLNIHCFLASCQSCFSLLENKIRLQSGETNLQMTWHFSSLSDCISPGDAFPFKENHDNSNLWDIGSVRFTSKQEEFSLNCYLIRIKRSYHWSYLHFILHPSLVCILATSPSPWGRICDSWRYKWWMLHIMLSPWKNCPEQWVVIFDPSYCPNTERIFRLKGRLWNAKESLTSAMREGTLSSLSLLGYEHR